jgi:dihydrofolate reductase
VVVRGRGAPAADATNAEATHPDEEHLERIMPSVRASGLTISLDGFLAGPGQSLEAPLGIGGERLHEWAFATRSMRRLHGMEGGEEGVDDEWASRHDEGIGATIMGRNMFGPIRGPWGDEEWRGWWGDDPPFHHPVFVLTHHPRERLELEGGTTFEFVTGGIHEALERASEAAAERDVRIGGGASTVGQYLRAGLIDELHLVIAPIVLGSGQRLFADLPSLGEAYECVQSAAGERATHFRLERRS